MNKTIFAGVYELRLYENHGWTEAEARACLKQGELKRKLTSFNGPYWTLKYTGSQFDVTKLIEAADVVIDWDGEPLPDRAWGYVLETYNW